MRRIVEHTLLSADGSMDVERGDFRSYQDDAYLRDHLAQLHASDALLYGRNMYEVFAKVYPARREHPWAGRVNAMQKYVFSSTLERADWDNTTIVRGDVVKEVARLKEQDGGDLLLWGHTRLAEALMRAGLIDVLDLAIHPFLVGSANKLMLREGQAAKLKLAATATFSKIVKLTYVRE
jgi:dihydrofolate reductase